MGACHSTESVSAEKPVDKVPEEQPVEKKEEEQKEAAAPVEEKKELPVESSSAAPSEAPAAEAAPVAAEAAAPSSSAAEAAVSPSEAPVVVEHNEVSSSPAVEEEAASSSSSSSSDVAVASSAPSSPLIYVIYYSMYGHVGELAKSIGEGIEQSGARVKYFRVPETLSEDILAKMGAPAPSAEVPVISPAELVEADGIVFGFPTRYGSSPAQVRALFDATGQLWAKGALIGKPFSLFVSTGGVSGGQETTAFTSMSFFVHQGMIFVPLGYVSPLLFDLEQLHGGSPWGAGTLAGPTGQRKPLDNEKEVGKVQGKHFGGVVAALKKGREIVSQQSA